MSDSQDDQVSPQVEDNPNPAVDEAGGIVAPTGGEPAADEATEPTPSSPREEIAARFKARRDAEERPGEEMDPMTVPPFIRQQEEAARAAEAAAAEPEPEPAAPAADDTTRYKLKVYGNEVEVTRAEMVRMAGLEDAEAADVPLPALIKAAQLTAAAEARLNDARSRRSDPPAEADRPAATEHPEATAQDDQPVDPLIADAISEITFGDPEEAGRKLTKAVQQAIRSQTDQVSTEAYNAKVRDTVQDFTNRNADLFNDPLNANFVYTASMMEIKADLVKAGMDPASLDAAVTTPEQAANALHRARQEGLSVRDPSEILEAAVGTVRSRLNLQAPSAPTSTAPPATAPVSTDRRELKRQLSPQPVRASAPPAVPTPAPALPEAKRSSVVEQMRRARGQA